MVSKGFDLTIPHLKNKSRNILTAYARKPNLFQNEFSTRNSN